MAFIVILNLAAIIQLAPHAYRLMGDYFRQRADGRDPVFHRSMLPEIEVDIECWDEASAERVHDN